MKDRFFYKIDLSFGKKEKIDFCFFIIIINIY